uniref:Uncharacterized protein n=2 Tax=Phlebotomus papatasi TaxID=29031 RepID=A0A1B0FYB7_PHLPP
MLKEQVLRLKMALEDADDNSAKAGGSSNVWSPGNTLTYQPQNAYAPPNLPVPMLLVISILIGILCILFGKYVL